MDALDIAFAEVKRQKAEEEEKRRRKEEEDKIYESNRKFLTSEMNKTLDAFNGVCGIVRQKDELWQRNKLIARAKVIWDKWENPNYDYRVEEKGLVIKYEINPNASRYDSWRGVYISTSTVTNSSESFAKYMAEFLK